MSRQRKQATPTDRASASVSGDMRKLLADASVEQLKRLGKSLGNEGLVGKMGQAEKLRVLLLNVVRERLEAIQLAQKAEIKALHERGPWFRRLRRGDRGIALPEPTRWGEPARLYRQAAEAICAGDLGRGADLLKQATENERSHRKAVPAQVKLPAEKPVSAVAAGAVEQVRDGEGCAPTTAPDITEKANRIENVQESMDEVSRLPTRRHGTEWWVEDAAAEEKKLAEEKANPGPSRRLLEPAAKETAERTPGREAPAPVAAREVRVDLRPERTAPGPASPGTAEPVAAAKPARKGPKR